MKSYPFTLSLKPNIQVIPSDDSYTLKPTEKNGLPANNILTFATFPGIDNALECLQQGNTTDALLETIAEKDGIDASEAFSATLQQIGDRGWLQYAVLPLAIAVPMVESAGVHLNPPHWTQANVSLSRFAYQRSHDGGMVLESPLSKFRVKLLDWRASAILAQLAQPQSLRQVTPPPQVGPETAYQFLNLLWATGFLDLEAEAPALKLWEFHNLLFHSRCRQGRHNYPTADIASSLDVWDEFPVVKPAMSGQIVPLPQLSIDAIRQRDKTLTTAIEKRSSIREYDENHPITIEQLGELLYRSARVQEIYTTDAEQTEILKAQFGEDFDWGELSRRPYPCGGAMYELEIYPVVRRCAGVNPGLYHYDPLNHQLAQIDAADADIQALLKDAHQSSGEQGMPQVLLIITARFGRLFRKYRSLAYALVLKHVGVLYQNVYLVATNMNLAPCSLGAGDSDRFASASGLNYIEESSVGEFMLGSLPHPNETVIPAQTTSETTETVIPAQAGIQETQAISTGVESSELTQSNVETDVGLKHETQPTPAVITAQGGIQETRPTLAEPISSQLSAQTTEPATMNTTALVTPSEAKTVALHPHDLDERIPGLINLRNQTLGDSRITIVILDGNADHTLSCFDGANISKVFPYWHDTPEPISVEAYATYQEIDNSDLKSEEKQEKWKAVLPEPILKRIQGDSHACHITSTIVGQENTPSPGLAPNCRVINIPLNTTGNDEEFVAVLNLSRAFELALELGANIIHCAACRPTQTGEGEELLMKALKKCQDNNVLVVAPAGNNKGECWCMPAVLPGTLAVGAMKEDGVTPYKFSNWGGNNQIEGIMAPGGEILGAQPATEEPKRLKGTSMAAPVMTGLCGLLMSLQLQKGKPVDAEAVRAALLNTAIPCDPNIVEEPERCLRGFVNLPDAMNLLFGQPSVTISFTGGGVTRVESAGRAIEPVIKPAAASTSETLSTVASGSDYAQMQNQSSAITPSFALERPLIDCTPGFLNVLSKLGVSLLISAYAGELTAVCPSGEARNIPFSEHKLQGIAVDGQEIILSTRDHIWQFRTVEKPSSLDLVGHRVASEQSNIYYKLDSVHETGTLNIHEIEKIGQKLWLSNTQYSCVCTLKDGGDFVVEWHPPFISDLRPEDRCHLNGLGIRDGKIRYVTALGETDTPSGWRDFRHTSGIVMDIETNQILLRGLSMPHSPRWYNSRLWLLEATKGSLISFNTLTKEVKTIVNLPGFTRGLDFVQGVAFIGTSRCRQPMCEDNELNHCGVWAVDLQTGEKLGSLTFKQGQKEISAVRAIKGISLPVFLDWPQEQLQTSPVNLGKGKPVSRSPRSMPQSHTPQSSVKAASASDAFTPSTPVSSSVVPSTAHSGHVYALGTIGYDFGSEARRDTFKQLMSAVDLNGVMVPANPYNTRQMVDYVDQNPDEGRSLIWTLNVDLNPVYVLEPKGPFAPEVYEMLLIMLDGQIEPETSDEFIERVSVPARRTNRTVELMSGQVVPVITLHHVRGMYGWKVNTLVNAALRAVEAEDEASIEAIRYSLTSFLNRVYYDLRNLGQTSRDRALNFAATNTFQAASTFAEAIADGRQLDSIEVEKSPYCRINSDCWDVKLKFFDPNNGRRARKVFRFTIDVAENLPVTLGKVKSWSVPK